ncbi:MAG TPA: hypothetical protein VHC22_21600 [Pirellulales bacterium]|nr:hypothetical protein [Pirellulales bacterium]
MRRRNRSRPARFATLLVLPIYFGLEPLSLSQLVRVAGKPASNDEGHAQHED